MKLISWNVNGIRACINKGFYDVLKYTTKPFVASHSNARGICGVGRNLSDDMIKELAKRNGVMGINFCGDFLKTIPNGNARSCIEDMLKI